MNTILSVAAIVLLGAVAMFLVRKISEEIVNYKIIRKNKLHPDLSKRRAGIVYNSDTKKLEEDYALILPY